MTDLNRMQVVLLSGPIPIMRLRDLVPNKHHQKPSIQLLALLENRYYLPMMYRTDGDGLHANNTHYYIVPMSVKTLHPEFDPVFRHILHTDPHALIVVTTVRGAREQLPVMHSTVRHDILHPAMPLPSVQQFFHRVKRVVGPTAIR